MPAESSEISLMFSGGVDSTATALILAEQYDRVHLLTYCLVRHGQNCAHHWYNSRGIPHTVRASFGIHNTVEEVERFAGAVSEVLRLVG